MTATTDPADPAELDDRVESVRAQIHQLRRTVRDLATDYAEAPPAAVAVDDLGDPLSAHAALAGTRAAIADMSDKLALAEDAAYLAKRYTTRMYRHD